MGTENRILKAMSLINLRMMDHPANAVADRNKTLLFSKNIVCYVAKHVKSSIHATQIDGDHLVGVVRQIAAAHKRHSNK